MMLNIICTDTKILNEFIKMYKELSQKIASKLRQFK